MILMKESVLSLNKKTKQHWISFFQFQIATKYLIFYD